MRMPLTAAMSAPTVPDTSAVTTTASRYTGDAFRTSNRVSSSQTSPVAAMRAGTATATSLTRVRGAMPRSRAREARLSCCTTRS